MTGSQLAGLVHLQVGVLAPAHRGPRAVAMAPLVLPSGVSGSLCDPAPASRGEKGSDRWRRAISISAALCVQSDCEKTDARGEIRGAREETRDETRSNSAEREERSEKRGASSERRGEARRESSLAAAQDAPLLRQDSCGAPQPLRILCQPRRDWRK